MPCYSEYGVDLLSRQSRLKREQKAGDSASQCGLRPKANCQLLGAASLQQPSRQDQVEFDLSNPGISLATSLQLATGLTTTYSDRLS